MLKNFPAQFTFSIQILPVPILIIFWQNIGNKAKWRISERVFQENKVRQIFRKTKISYPLIRTHETSTLVLSYEFWKIFRTYFSQNTSRQLLLKKESSNFKVATSGNFSAGTRYFTFILLMERIMSVHCTCWNLFLAPVRKNAHFFCKHGIYKQHQPETVKKNREKSSSTLRLIICKLFAFFIHVFYHIVSGYWEEKCAKKQLRMSRLSDFLIYYNENENENEKQIT